jgi:hypothetical protein
VRDRDERHGAGRRRLILGRRRLERLQLAACGAVENVPSPGSQLFADGIRGVEVAFAPALDALC